MCGSGRKLAKVEPESEPPSGAVGSVLFGGMVNQCSGCQLELFRKKNKHSNDTLPPFALRPTVRVLVRVSALLSLRQETGKSTSAFVYLEEQFSGTKLEGRTNKPQRLRRRSSGGSGPTVAALVPLCP